MQGLRFSTKRGSLKLVPRFVEHGQIFDDFLVNRSVDAGTTQLVENFTISKPAQGLRVVGNHLLPSPGSCRNFTDFVEYKGTLTALAESGVRAVVGGPLPAIYQRQCRAQPVNLTNQQPLSAGGRLFVLRIGDKLEKRGRRD